MKTLRILEQLNNTKESVKEEYFREPRQTQNDGI